MAPLLSWPVWLECAFVNAFNNDYNLTTVVSLNHSVYVIVYTLNNPYSLHRNVKKINIHMQRAIVEKNFCKNHKH